MVPLLNFVIVQALLMVIGDFRIPLIMSSCHTDDSRNLRNIVAPIPIIVTNMAIITTKYSFLFGVLCHMYPPLS